MNERFIIPLNGLTAGKSEYVWTAGKEFFESFDNAEIIDAELDVNVVVEKSGRYVGVDCDIDGEVTVECDRCLDELDIPVDVEVRLSVKYGDEESSDAPQEGEREVVFVPEDEAEFDMSQIIYDYVCISLPMQRIHEEGQCDPAAIRHLSGESAGMEQESADNPFAALKDLIK